MKIITINKKNYFNIIKNKLPLFMVFTSKNCHPCKEMYYHIKIASKIKNVGTIAICDVDENEELAEHYNIHSIPSSFFIRSDNKIVNFSSGVKNAEYIFEIFDKNNVSHNKFGIKYINYHFFLNYIKNLFNFKKK